MSHDNTFNVGLPLTLMILMSTVVLGQEDSAAPAFHHYFAKSQHQHEAKWGYSGTIGPQNWGALSPEYRLASEGQQQSPIDIPTEVVRPTELPRLRIDYKPEERIALVNNGHAIQHNETPGSFLHVGNRLYALEQFHMHVPSEHTIDGRHADMEIHLVHKSSAGEVAVVAVLVAVNADQAARPRLIEDLPRGKNEVVEIENFSANPAHLLPTDYRYYTYTGSLTTPPCSEGVRWIVMSTPVPIHPAALAAYKKTIGDNSRPVQSLHDREIRGPAK